MSMPRIDSWGNTITRRHMLAAGGALAAVGLIELYGSGAAAAALRGAPGYLRRSAYKPLIGQSFTLRGAHGPTVTTRLSAVGDIGSRRNQLANSDDAFALTFHAPQNTQLDQGTVTMRHATLGTFQLFVVPASTGRKSTDFVAIVNRAH